MNYENYSKEQLIVMIKRNDYLLGQYMETVEQLQALPELSFGEIDDLIEKYS